MPDPTLGPAIALPGLGCLSGLFTSSYKLKQATLSGWLPEGIGFRAALTRFLTDLLSSVCWRR